MDTVNASNNFQWEVIEKKGKFRGINLAYEGSVDRNETLRAFASVLRRYGFRSEIQDMDAYVSGAPMEVTDTPLSRFEKEYGYNSTRIAYLDIIGRRSSLKAKLTGKVPPYVQLTAGYAKTMEVLTSDIDINETLEILDEFSKQLNINIPTGFIKSDVDFLAHKKA